MTNERIKEIKGMYAMGADDKNAPEKVRARCQEMVDIADELLIFRERFAGPPLAFIDGKLQTMPLGFSYATFDNMAVIDGQK